MKQPRFQVYEARDGWRWRLLAANGRTIADSGEAYKTKSGVKRAVSTVTATVEHIGHQAMIDRIRGSSHKQIEHNFRISGATAQFRDD